MITKKVLMTPPIVSILCSTREDFVAEKETVFAKTVSCLDHVPDEAWMERKD